MALPYFKVAELHPYAERTIGDISVFSPPASGFFTAPAESRIWGGLHEGARAALPWHPEMTLLPGFVLYALAAGRAVLLGLAAAAPAAAARRGAGDDGPGDGHPVLRRHASPTCRCSSTCRAGTALRTPGRLMLWTTLLLGAARRRRGHRVRRPGPRAGRAADPVVAGPVAAAGHPVPLLLVLAEGLNTTPHPVVPTQPAAMRTAEGPMLVLPSDQSLRPARDALVDRPVPGRGQRRQRLHARASSTTSAG